MTIGEKIKQYRIRELLTTRELADRLGVNRSLISLWEHNKRNPSITSLRKMRDRLGIDFNAIDRIPESAWDGFDSLQPRHCFRWVENSAVEYAMDMFEWGLKYKDDLKRIPKK